MRSDTPYQRSGAIENGSKAASFDRLISANPCTKKRPPGSVICCSVTVDPASCAAAGPLTRQAATLATKALVLGFTMGLEGYGVRSTDAGRKKLRPTPMNR